MKNLIQKIMYLGLLIVICLAFSQCAMDKFAMEEILNEDLSGDLAGDQTDQTDPADQTGDDIDDLTPDVNLSGEPTDADSVVSETEDDYGQFEGIAHDDLQAPENANDLGKLEAFDVGTFSVIPQGSVSVSESFDVGETKIDFERVNPSVSVAEAETSESIKVSPYEIEINYGNHTNSVSIYEDDDDRFMVAYVYEKLVDAYVTTNKVELEQNYKLNYAALDKYFKDQEISYYEKHIPVGDYTITLNDHNEETLTVSVEAIFKHLPEKDLDRAIAKALGSSDDDE